MINSGDVPLKLATVFVPAYKASDNYKRCLDAAEAQAVKQSDAPRYQLMDVSVGDRSERISAAGPANSTGDLLARAAMLKVGVVQVADNLPLHALDSADSAMPVIRLSVWD